jgi:hypothetical protein
MNGRNGTILIRNVHSLYRLRRKAIQMEKKEIGLSGFSHLEDGTFG